MKRLGRRSNWIAVALAVLLLVYVTVDQFILAPEGSTKLTWAAPVQDENNEPLGDLAGYVIHCWTASGLYRTKIYINDPAITSYVLEKLASDTYYCAVTAVNNDGGESALSNIVAKIVN